MSEGAGRPKQPFPCNVAMVGMPGVGKTSLVRRYVESIFTHDYLPTMGVQISKKTVALESRDVQFILWDLEGQNDRRQLRDSYLKHADAYILVADVTRSISFDHAIGLQGEIRELLPDAPFVVALNKSDLGVESAADRLAMADSAWTLIRTSAKTGQGVEEVFTVLAERRLAYESSD